jgi:hypothetical protein
VSNEPEPTDSEGIKQQLKLYAEFVKPISIDVNSLILALTNMLETGNIFQQ